MEKINKTECLFLEKINKIDKPSVKLIKKRETEKERGRAQL